MSTSVAQISALGLTELQKQILHVAVGLLEQEGLQFQLLPGNNPNGQLLVVDGDTKPGQYALTHAPLQQVKLAFTSSASNDNPWNALTKPIRVAALKDALASLHQSALMVTIASTTVETNVPAEHASAPSILDILYKAKQNNQILQLSDKGIGDLFINCVNDSYASPAEPVNMDIISDVLKSEVQIVELQAEQYENSVRKLTLHALNGLLWHIGIHCSDGKLIQGHSMNEAIKLRAWPNFTRNSFQPQHLKIAAVMAKQPITLNQLKELVKLPEAEVVNFYNAALVVDLIDGQLLDTVPSPPPVKLTQGSGLLRKLAQRLGFA